MTTDKQVLNNFAKDIIKRSTHKGIVINIQKYGIFIKLEKFKDAIVLCSIPHWIDYTPKIGDLCIVEIARIRKDSGKIDGRIKRIIGHGIEGNKKLYINKFKGKGLYFINNTCAVSFKKNGIECIKNGKSIFLTKEEVLNIFDVGIKKGIL